MARSVLILTLALGLLTTGCADDVTAPPGVDEPYSIYGILNPRLLSQTMLLAPPSRFFQDYPETIDAVVTSTNVETGEMISWRDSVVTGHRGQRDHVFVAPFRPEFGSHHRVRVERSDGVASTVEVNVPGRVSFELDDGETRYFAGRVVGERVRVLRAEATYRVRLYKPWSMTTSALCEDSPPSDVSISMSVIDHLAAGSWVLETDMHEDWDVARSYYSNEHDVLFHDPDEPIGLALMDLSLDIAIGNESWNPPGDTFDMHLLSSPHALTNVGNGFGFVGAGYNQEFTVWPSKKAVEDAWFYDFLMRPPTDCLDFCSCGYQ